MPYIYKQDREALNPRTDRDIATAGELNFCLTRLCDQFVGDELNYQKINDVIGALEGARLEFYHRVARAYEDKKSMQNGDVYRVR